MLGLQKYSYVDRPRGSPQQQIDIAVDALARLIYGEHNCSLSLLFLAQAAALSKPVHAALMSPEMYANCSSLTAGQSSLMVPNLHVVAPAGLDDGAPLTSEDTASFQQVVAGAFPDVPQVDQLVQDSIAGRSGRKGAYL